MRLFLACLLLLLLRSSGAWSESTHASAESKPLVPKNRWAVVIGVSDYSADIGPLKYTSKEAREFAGFLTAHLGFEPQNVKLLADRGPAAEAPTSKHILAAIDQLLADKRLDRANLFLFYFSGHGVGTPTGDYLLPTDSKRGNFDSVGVPVKQVIKRVVDAGLKNVLFIADACRAGTENAFGVELTALCHKANIAVILGCAPGKRSYEYAELHQGAFTHFLLQNLANPKIRDGSGSLWASKLGELTQSQVQAYTEPEHGKFAQIPALWGERSTLDVLLATYPQPPVSDQAIQFFNDKAKRLGRQEYAMALISYADELMLNDRYDRCIEALKTVDQLGELTPHAQYILASALALVGRTGEAERVFTRFVDQPAGYYRDLAMASSSSKQLNPALRIQAARRMLSSDPVWTDKMFAWSTIHTWGTYEEQLDCAKIFAALSTDGPRHALYAAGCLADVQGNGKVALAAYAKALSSPGGAPSDDVFYYSMLRSTSQNGDRIAMDRLLSRCVNRPSLAPFCYLERAQLAKQDGSVPGRVDFLKQALAGDLDPEEVWLATRIAGPYIAQVREDLQSAAERHPFSWRCRIVLAFIKKIGGDDSGSMDEVLVSDRYMDDPLNFCSSFFDLMDSFMTEAVKIGTLKPEVYRSQIDYYFLTLLGFADRFGFDPDLWGQFAQYGLFNERNLQVDQIIQRHMPFPAERAPRGLRPLLMLLAMNRGDVATSNRVYGAKFEPSEHSDPGWFYALYLVTQGKTLAAAKLVKSLGPPSKEIAPRAEALKTYIMAASGESKRALKRLSANSEDSIARGLQGLAWSALGDWKRAEPLLEEQSKSRVWTFLFVQEYCLRVLDARYRRTSRLAAARQLAFSAMASQPGNPLFKHFAFVAKPSPAQFAGEVQLDLGVCIDDVIERKLNGTADFSNFPSGKLRFRISASGDVTGAFVEQASKATHPFRGHIDGLGNLTGTGEWGGHNLELTGKLAPAPLYKTDANLRAVGQVLQLIAPSGDRIIYLGRPG